MTQDARVETICSQGCRHVILCHNLIVYLSSRRSVCVCVCMQTPCPNWTCQLCFRHRQCSSSCSLNRIDYYYSMYIVTPRKGGQNAVMPDLGTRQLLSVQHHGTMKLHIGAACICAYIDNLILKNLPADLQVSAGSVYTRKEQLFCKLCSRVQ